MGYVRSRKFCCCLPVRFGVFVMSILGIIAGGVIGAIGWYKTGHISAYLSFIVPYLLTFLERTYI